MRASKRIVRHQVQTVQTLENRWLLSEVAPLVVDPVGLAAAATVVPLQLSAASDTGVSATDGITSDNTPLFEVSVPELTSPTIWVGESRATGIRYIELDAITGSLTGRQFEDTWGSYQYAYGSAISNDGKLYTVGSMDNVGQQYLRTYDIASGQRISEIPLSTPRVLYGLAYLSGKLYASDYSGMVTIDAASGAVLKEQTVFADNWMWRGTGPGIAASPGENVLYTINVYGGLTSINPDTARVINEVPAEGYRSDISGLAYIGGSVLAVTYSGTLMRYNPMTGQLLSSMNLPGGMYGSLAGDGGIDPTFYRVFSDGALISEPFESSPTFEAPQLADGVHSILLQYVNLAGNVTGTAEMTIEIDTGDPVLVADAPKISSDSDTGISSSDGITSDPSPVLEVSVPGSATALVLQGTTQGLIFTEIVPATGEVIRTFVDESMQINQWGFGAAIGDGVIYVSTYDSSELRTYDLATGDLIRSVPTVRCFALAYLDGKLYGSDGMLVTLNPETGAVMNRRNILAADWTWIGSGLHLAEDPTEGNLYSISFENKLVKMDPITGTAVVIAPMSGEQFSGLVFANGELYATTYMGGVFKVDTRTGARTQVATLPLPTYTYGAIAADARQESLYYRVFANGVQVSGDYETSPEYEFSGLADGIYSVTITYVDAAGNLSPAGAPLILRVDTSAPATPATPVLAPGSGSGVVGDGLTNVSEPTIVLERPTSATTVIALGERLGGHLFMMELDARTRAPVREVELDYVPSQTWEWARGTAAGDGVLYMVAPIATSPMPDYDAAIYAFDMANGAFLYSVPLPRDITLATGLAYLNGSLFVAAGILYEVDPISGEVLDSFYPMAGETTTAIGANLAADADAGHLYAIDWMGQLLRIDPETRETVLIHRFSSAPLSLAYAGGELIYADTMNLTAVRLDPATGETLGTYDTPYYNFITGLAEDGQPSDYYRVFVDGVQVSADYEQDGSFQLPQLADGEYSITVAYVDVAGNVSGVSDALILRVDTVKPTASVMINDGSAQRSMVNQITVTFSEWVTLSAEAISLTMLDGSAIVGTEIAVANPSGDGMTWVIHFSGDSVVAGSLADGLYQLTIHADGVQDAAGNHLESDISYGFHRLFGDGAGDGSVGTDELLELVSALSNRAGALDYIWYYDFDSSGRVSATDLRALLDRMTA